MSERLTYWDSQFRFSAILPDFQQCLDTMAAASRVVEDSMPLARLAYGSDPRQWAELSDGPDGDIVPVFVHGGYWRALRAEDHRFLLPSLRGIGPRVGNIEYRLMPGARLDELIADVAAGLNTLAEHRAKDSKLLVIGHSAGAHLALASVLQGAAQGRVAGLVGISGLYDLAPVPHSFVQAEIQLTPDEVAAGSIHQSTPPVPTLLVVGGNETGEFQRQAEMLSSHSGAPVLRVAGTHHMTVLTAMADVDAPPLTAIREWLATGRLSAPICGASP